MGSLELRLDKQHLGIEMSLGVVARVRQIKDAAGDFPARPEDREVVIPAGRQAKRRLDDVPAGTYRIEARLPSGEVLREIRQVTDDPHAPAEVVFDADHSPREWLSWQRLAGNVPSQQEYETWLTKLAEHIVRAAKAKDSAAKPIEIDKTVIQALGAVVRNLHIKFQPLIGSVAKILARTRGRQIKTGAETAPAPIDAPSPVPATAAPAELELLQADPRAATDLWDAVASLAAYTAWRRTALRHVGCEVTRHDDRELTLWRIMQVDRAGSTVTARAGKRLPLRCLAVMRKGDGVDVITLPVPWPLDADLPAPAIEILREAGTAESGRTTTTVCDAVVGGLIMYLNNGRLADAATVLAEADRTGLVERLMSEKSDNPLAACAAAYVGFATLSGDERPRWAPWLSNLENWFEWLPDGAIVHAAYRLRTAQTRDDLDGALASLKQAYRRGIPFYTAGLQHLMNGLYTFSEQDTEAKAMYDKVGAVALRVDPTQAFNHITIAARSR